MTGPEGESQFGGAGSPSGNQPDNGVSHHPYPRTSGAPEPPQRLSLLSLLVHPVSQLGSLLVPLLGLILLGGALDGQRFALVPLVLVLAAAVSLARWATFTYQVRDEQLDIAHGVLSRQRRSIPLDRIRGIDVTASFLHRLLGVAVVRVDAAAGGGGEQEGELDAVSAAEAERLRRVLLRARHAGAGGSRVSGDREWAPPREGATETATATHTEAPAEGPTGPDGAVTASRISAESGTAEQEPVVLARLRPRWYLYAPLTAHLFVPLVGLGALIGSLSELAGPGPGAPISGQKLRRAFELGATMPYVLAVGGGLLLLLATPLLAIAAFALTNWRFTLRRRGSSLITDRGLFNRRSVSLERERIRGWELREGLLPRIAGAARLRALVTGLGDVQSRAELLPVAPRGETLAVARRAVGPFDQPLLTHPPAARTRRLVRAVVPWVAAAAVAEFVGVRWLALALALMALAGVPLGLDRYRSLGHAADPERVSVRSGSLVRRQAVIERRAVVGWTFRQTWLQRRVGLVTLVIGVGAGDGGYPVVDTGTAEAARFVAQVTPSWVSRLLVHRD